MLVTIVGIVLVAQAVIVPIIFRRRNKNDAAFLKGTPILFLGVALVSRDLNASIAAIFLALSVIAALVRIAQALSSRPETAA